MKERILLFLIVLGLGVFIYIFQSYFNTVWGLAFLLICMAIYAGISTLAYKIKSRRLKKHPEPVNENYKPFVSIMIPAHNEEGVITETIENVLALDYPNFEILVIDDRSTDNTANVIKDLEKKYDKVTAFVRPKDAFPGKSAVLNDALPMTKGEAILVFDADARVDKDFLTKLVPHLEPKDVGAVQARKVIRNANVNQLTRCQNNEMTMDTHLQVGRDSVRGAVELRGNGELIKREALEDIHGWNNYTITDDLDMSTRLHIKGWDVRFSPDTIVYEEGIMYLIPLYRQRRRWLEGTIRRYLEYAGDVLTSRDMSLRVSLDLVAYISQFLMPAWFFMELFIRIFKIVIKDAPTNMIYSSLVIGAVIGFGFFCGARYSLRRYDNMPRGEAFVQAIYTSIYLLMIWFPLVLFIGFKILFLKKDMNWGKTAHGLVQHEHAIQRAKEKIRQAKEELKKLIRAK